MDYQSLINEFIELKKSELSYINYISTISYNKQLTDKEKLHMYRKLKNYEELLNKKLNEIKEKIKSNKNLNINKNDIILEFNIDNSFLEEKPDYERVRLFNYLNITGYYKESFYQNNNLKIGDLKYSLTYTYKSISCYKQPFIDEFFNRQSLVDKSVYLVRNYYKENCLGFNEIVNDPNNADYVIVENILSYYQSKTIKMENINDFNKNNRVFECASNINYIDYQECFKKELLNPENNSIEDCLKKTFKNIEKLSIISDAEYKEKVLLDKINNLYSKVKGTLIDEKLLYSGVFLDVIKETYHLPNNKTISKEKVIKNKSKDSAIIVAVTDDDKFLLTFQNRINNAIITEFTSGYIENEEDIIEATNRELLEETGYVCEKAIILDQIFTSPGIDNSKTYIVLANNCKKINEPTSRGNEFLSYDLFSKKELDYIIEHNYMCGSLNKLAYYVYINYCNNEKHPCNKSLTR